MTGTTSDRNDPRLSHGADTEPGPQSEVYLVLPDGQRRPFVRPVRRSYMHVGPPGPQYPLLDLTLPQNQIHGDRYAKYEQYPESVEHAALGRFWTQEQLDKVVKGGCGTVTTMGQALAETYAASPGFYGATYCCGCSMHLPVGKLGEFVWMDGDVRTDERVGT